MLQNYLDMVLYDEQTSLVTLTIFLAAGFLAFWLHHTHRRTLWVSVGISCAALILAAGFWYGEGGLGGGIFAMTLCLFGLPALVGHAAGWLLSAQWPRIRQHRAAVFVLAILLILLANWARPRQLTRVRWASFTLQSGYVSQEPNSYASNVLVTEDGGESWQVAKVRNADEINAAIGGIRCGPQYLYLTGLPHDLPDEQLIVQLNNELLLLTTCNGPSYLIRAYFDWHLILEHSGTEGFELPQRGLRSRVLGYPALYRNIDVWLTEAESNGH